jgi:hypothetical protein
MIGSAEQKTLMKIIKIMETKDTKGNKVPIDPDNKSKHHLTGDGSAQSNPRNIILMTTITMIKYKGIWSRGIILSRGRGPRVPFSECPKLFGFPFFHCCASYVHLRHGWICIGLVGLAVHSRTSLDLTKSDRATFSCSHC